MNVATVNNNYTTTATLTGTTMTPPMPSSKMKIAITNNKLLTTTITSN